MVDKSAVASGTRAEKPGRMRELRRTIARIHTIQKEKLTKKPDIQKEKITKKTDVQKIEKKGIKEVRNKK